jgi:GntR family transcriptional regulator
MTSPEILFTIRPSSGLPIYRQLMEQVHALIASGRIAPGDLLPSVRQVAMALDVNMMTVSKAYARLEADGVLERVRGTGMRVVDAHSPAPVEDRQDQLSELAEHLVARGHQLGLKPREILAVVRQSLEEKESWFRPSSASKGSARDSRIKTSSEE